MKITIPPEFFQKLVSNFKSLNITILKIKEKSSLISILGKKFEIPVKLDENKLYKAEIKKDELLIKEVIKKKPEEFLKTENEQKNIENDFVVKENYIYSVYDLLKKFFYREYKNKRNFSFSNKNGKDYFFAFSLPLYDTESKIFLKIDKDKNVFIETLSSGKEYLSKKNELYSKLKKKLNKNIKSLNLVYNIKDENFYNKIFSMIALKNVDINI